MLRDKIDKEMEKFKIVEFAFKEIKTATVIVSLFRVLLMLNISSKSISTKRLYMVNFSARLLIMRRSLNS